ncbi:MAG: STAS domain-containing protein [Candidatus Nitricoxidivorans perseverans]|uniref:STAS domain-containing protein n=1 Tax=Candidatus Nitricoxidivorans perseverans TaxID=2975601 RepID=A0AA49FK99_9PROT|nr:MAG: STAS domain-containing protein [Candidatus Nitricoxidivorans perseverans]
MAFSIFSKKPSSPVHSPKAPAPAGPVGMKPAPVRAPVTPVMRPVPTPAEDDLVSLDFTMPDALDAVHPRHVIQVEEVARQMPGAIEQAAMLYSANQVDEACAVIEAALREKDLGVHGQRAWGMLFDLYQMAGRRDAFESLALDFAARFETSPPTWTDEGPESRDPSAMTGGRAFVSLSGILNAKAQTPLRKLLKVAEQNPVVRLDLAKVSDADEEGCTELRNTIAAIRKAKREIVMGGAERLADILARKIVPGVRENEHVWLLLLDLYQHLLRQEAFEETAVNYAVTFEVSPPSWDAPGARKTSPPPEAPARPVEGCVLQGEIVAAGADVFAMMRVQAEKGDEVIVDCQRLQRMDFVSAGQLLNVVGNLRAAGKRVRLRGANHLVAALWEVIGLGRIAVIEPRKN